MANNPNPAVDSIKAVINEDGFKTYAVRFDVNDKGENFYDLDSFVNALIYELPDFSYGGEFWKNVEPANSVNLVSEAAKAIYQIPEFNKVKEVYDTGGCIEDTVDDSLLRRGEFGELILFFLLKNFNGTVPLLSKIYFKDSDGSTVHGFDAVHYHEDSSSLWLGESKIYENSKAGLKSLIEDTKKHVISEYLKREFVLVGKKFKLAGSISDNKRDKILDLLNPENSLENKIKNIYLPLLCTFPCNAFSSYDTECKEFIDAYKAEMVELKKYFDDNNDHPLKDKLNIILLLMPVKSKKELIVELHKRLFHAQSIIK